MFADSTIDSAEASFLLLTPFKEILIFFHFFRRSYISTVLHKFEKC